MLNDTVFLSWALQFFLIFTRTASIFTVSPVFGRKNVPSVLKIMFSILLSYILIGIFPPDSAREYTLISYTAACIKELIVGLTIGFVTTLFFAITISAGQVIDLNIGFSMAQVFDVQMGSTIPLMGNFLNMIMLLSFFIVDGHHTLIRILADTFKYMKPGNFSLSFDLLAVVSQTFILTIVMGMKIAMPVLVASFLTEMTMGIVIRAVPQMNMFVVGIPLRLLIGLGLMLIIAPMFMELTNSIFNDMFNTIQEIFAGMVAA